MKRPCKASARKAPETHQAEPMSVCALPGGRVKNLWDFCQKRNSLHIPTVSLAPRCPAEPPGKPEAMQPVLLSGWGAQNSRKASRKNGQHAPLFLVLNAQGLKGRTGF